MGWYVGGMKALDLKLSESKPVRPLSSEERTRQRRNRSIKQHLFEIAEKRLCEDFTTYREVKYRGNEELMEMLKEEVQHCV